MPMPIDVTLYVTPLFLCVDGDLFGVHVTQRVPLDAVDEFDLAEDGRTFDLSWTETVRDDPTPAPASPSSPTNAADSSEPKKRKKKRMLRRNATLVLAESDAEACVALLRVVLKHASEQRSKHRKFVTRGALLDELLLHHRQLAREEAHVPRDSAALSLRAGGIFTDNDCMELASCARAVRLRAGDTLCEEGRREQRWYQVVRGELQLRRTVVRTSGGDESRAASPAAAAGAALPHTLSWGGCVRATRLARRALCCRDRVATRMWRQSTLWFIVSMARRCAPRAIDDRCWRAASSVTLRR
jgi:hypothetical protein